MTNRRRATQSGLTLMEMLIAVSLLSLITLGIMMAMRVGLSAMEKTNDRFVSNRKAIGVQRMLESQILGLMPVVADCRPGGGPPQGKISVFEGRPDSMRFVSSYSLSEAARGYPRLLEFRVIPGENNEGVRLIVNERVYLGPFMIGALCTGMAPIEGGPPMPQFTPIEPGPQSFVMADKLAYCRIVYKRMVPTPEKEIWLPVWNVLDALPSAIRIEMAPLHPDPGHLQLLTVTAPLHITKWVLGPYAD